MIPIILPQARSQREGQRLKWRWMMNKARFPALLMLVLSLSLAACGPGAGCTSAAEPTQNPAPAPSETPARPLPAPVFAGAQDAPLEDWRIPTPSEMRSGNSRLVATVGADRKAVRQALPAGDSGQAFIDQINADPQAGDVFSLYIDALAAVPEVKTIELVWSMDGTRWTLVARDSDSTILWARNKETGEYSAYPVQLPWRESGPEWDDSYELVPEDRIEEVIFAGSFPVGIGGKCVSDGACSMVLNTALSQMVAVSTVMEDETYLQMTAEEAGISEAMVVTLDEDGIYRGRADNKIWTWNPETGWVQEFNWEATRLRMIEVMGNLGYENFERDRSYPDTFWIYFFFSDNITIERVSENESYWYPDAYTLNGDNELVSFKILLQHEVNGMNIGPVMPIHTFFFFQDNEDAGVEYYHNRVAKTEEELLALMDEYEQVYCFGLKADYGTPQYQFVTSQGLQEGEDVVFEMQASRGDYESFRLNLP
ncbi:MAG: hypothetical protein FJZ96_10140 [Chloroflexi bacterium]|nr:hypothetical protein [Chloroflexota bacterium]